MRNLPLYLLLVLSLWHSPELIKHVIEGRGGRLLDTVFEILLIPLICFVVLELALVIARRRAREP
jgi:hypothetical protein